MPYRATKRIRGNKVFLRVHNSGHDEKSIFRTSADYKKFITILARLSRDTPTVGVVGYVLVRDAFCLIIEEVKRGDSSKFLHKLSVSYAMYFQFKYKNQGKLFKGPYGDSVIENEDGAVVELCKMHRLPENFKHDIETYLWSSYVKYLRNQAPWLHKQPVINYFQSDEIASALKDFTNTVALDETSC